LLGFRIVLTLHLCSLERTSLVQETLDGVQIFIRQRVQIGKVLFDDVLRYDLCLSWCVYAQV